MINTITQISNCIHNPYLIMNIKKSVIFYKKNNTL